MNSNGPCQAQWILAKRPHDLGLKLAKILIKNKTVHFPGKGRHIHLMPIRQLHAHRIFLCMRCKACEQVCQSKLHLIDAYDEMEKRLEKKHGKDEEEIKRFIALAEQSPAYDALVERGLVLGASAKAVQGGK